MSHNLRLLALTLATLGLTVLLGAGAASAQFSSAESICSASNTLFCDDFEDGLWWQTKENSKGAGNDGWEGCLYCLEAALPQQAVCSGSGAAGTNCAATSKLMTTTTGAGVNGKFEIAQTDELYVRFYWWVSPGFKWGHQKGLSFERDLQGHFDWGLFHHPFQSAELQFIQEYSDNQWRKQNQGNTLKMNVGGWYLMEAHIKLDNPGASDGLLEVWLDYCGTDGLGCENKAQTLRMRHTDMNFRAGSDTRKIGALWVNNWSNYIGQPPPLTAPPSEGEFRYDQFVVSRARIGPMNSTGTLPPSAPAPPPPTGPVSAPTWTPGS